MPGPSNVKKKPRKSNTKSPKNASKKSPQTDDSLSLCDPDSPLQLHPSHRGRRHSSGSPSLHSPTQPHTPASPVHFYELPLTSSTFSKEEVEAVRGTEELVFDDGHAPEFLPQAPFIHDPGNGPRVRDTRMFLGSFFAQPPALDDPMCAEFAQEEVLQMLMTVLPEETAMILWYNKSRTTSRICPACQRLYRLGDTLPDHINDEPGHVDKQPLPQLEREQDMSGLCSPVCFILASFNHPGVIKSAWGHMADEMDETTWSMLNGPGEGNAHGDISTGLGMLVRMTRLHDLGLGQLCFPDVDFDHPQGMEPGAPKSYEVPLQR